MAFHDALSSLKDARRELASQLKKIDALIDTMNEVGIGDGKVTKRRGRGARSGMLIRKTKIRRPRDPNKPCEICHVPGHDRRSHRKHPAPFTKAELANRGL